VCRSSVRASACSSSGAGDRHDSLTRRVVWFLLATVAVLSCLRDSTAPRVLSGHLAVAPEFESSSAGVVDFDRARITVVRPSPVLSDLPPSVVLDTVIAIPVTADSIDLSVSVPLLATSEDFLLYLRLINAAGDTVFRTSPYPQPVTVTSSSQGTPVATTIAYVGVGFDAVRVSITTPDTAVFFGQSLQLDAVAFGPNDSIIPGTPVAWRSLDSTRVRVPNRATGQVVGGTVRGTARIVAQLLNGPADTVLVAAQPTASTLAKISGDGQTAVPGVALPLPLRVRVTASDGLGVRVPVAFRAVNAGDSVASALVLSDSTGYAETVAILGPASGPRSFQVSVSGIASPATFTATALSGAVASVTLDRSIDTIARGATLQYTATARDSSGNPVSVTIGWTSTVPAVATVDGAGLASAVGGDSTRIIASAAGHADTAKLYVRVLRSVVPAPLDTVVTAIGDSFDLRATAYDNFGGVVSAGFTRRFFSATPTVVTVNPTTGRTRSVGAGNGVVVVRDSVDASLKVQGTATVRVNQVTFSIRNTPDTLQIGVNGRRAIQAAALDRNGHPIPSKTFGYRSGDAAIASVDAAGLVTGLALGNTFVIDSVDGFKDSVRIEVVAAPPALLQWGFDSLAVGNGGNVSVPLTLSRTDPAATAILLSVIPAADTMIARPATTCPGGTLKKVTIPANTSATSVLVCGLAAGRVTIVAQDSAGIFLPDTMVVTVVSTIEFREIGSFGRQTYFYVNQDETHQAQVFLSDPAPAGGLGVTFEYGRPGTSTVQPSPAIIPAGQLSAPVTIRGFAPGTDSVVPTSGGFVGKYSYVSVAPDSLRVYAPYPYAVGVGQSIDPYVSYQYAMDHPLVVSLSLSPSIGAVPNTVTVPTTYNYQYFTVKASAVGTAVVTATAPGWVAGSDTITFTTPQLGAGGTSSMVAGNPTRGSWSATTQDSIVRYPHPVVDTVTVTATSRDTTVVAVDAGVGKVRPGQYSVSVNDALRAQPGAGGRSTWIVLAAGGYRPDSFQVSVTAPALSFSLNYPSQVMVGGRFPGVGYLSIPYARPDSFTVVFQHARRGIVSGPDSVTIPKGLTNISFDIDGDTVGADTIAVSRATGYSLPPALPFNVVPIHVTVSSQPTTLYTISRPQLVNAIVRQETYPYYPNALVVPLRVNLASSNPGAFTLDSAGVTIPAGTYVSNYDTLRVNPASPGNDSGRVLVTAPGSTNDSSVVIRVLPTPLTLSVPYPAQAAYRLRLSGGSVYIPDAAPDTIRITLSHRLPLADSLSTSSIRILPGQSSSNSFEIIGLDSIGADTVTATAVGYVPSSQAFTVVPAQIDVSDIGANHVTTEPPYRVQTYVRMRPYPNYAQNAMDTVRFNFVSTDSSVIQIDSAETAGIGSGTSFVPPNQYYGYFKVRFVGSGTARIIVSAPGFGTDTLAPVTVTGPSLSLSLGTQQPLGVGQLFAPTPSQYVSVNNPVTGSPLVIQISKSDSTLSPASQAFTISATSVTIPVGATISNYFEVQGNAVGSAVLIARATGYNQAMSTVDVGQPKLVVSPQSMTISVGQAPALVTANVQDHAGNYRYVASALTVGDTSANPAVAAPDSVVLHIPARGYFQQVGVRGFVKGATQIVFSAAGYTSDTLVVQADTGQLTLNSPPNGLGAGQIAPSQMYVSLSYAVSDSTTISLASSNPAVLSVPAQVTIPKGTSYAYFPVTGNAIGSADVSATASGVKAATPVTVRISRPKFLVSLSSATNAGQKSTVTVYAQDSLGTARNPSAPLTVTLVSSVPGHTLFDSATIHIPTNNSYAQTGVVFDTAGSYILTASNASYASGSDTTTTTGALVTIADFSFAPQSVTITKNQFVTWKNTGAQTHTATHDTGTWNTGSIAAGGQGTVYFPTPGTYTYHCTFHPGMTGTVTVNP
jgi:plastocyanin